MIKNEQIIFITFESLDFSNIKTSIDLDCYIKEKTNKLQDYYVLIDEVQKIEDFELALNSLRIEDKYSIFVTGSNSKVTLEELSSDITGRYVSFKVLPLSFKEVVLLTDTKKEDYEQLLFNIFEWGSLPQRFLYDDEEMRYNYIFDVYSSIILKDIVERYNIKNTTLLHKVLNYILNIVGREFSSDNIISFMKNNHDEISTQTIYNYLEFFCSSFLISKVSRYDIQGKQFLKTLNKFYVTDLGIKKVMFDNTIERYAIPLENMVYHELIRKGYKVYIGKNKNLEVDFVASKNKNLKYIQVALYLSEETTIEREFGAFKNINDLYDKIVLSLDKINYSQKGIKYINVIDFFLNDDF